MADETIRSLDATDATQVLVSIQTWINGLKDPTTLANIIPERVYLESQATQFGYCLKGNGGAVIEEDICGNFSAEVPFAIYYTTNAVPDSGGEIFKPLNDLAAWFKANGTAGLLLGDRREPDQIITLKLPTDLSGKDTEGNITFFAVYQLSYDEEVL